MLSIVFSVNDISMFSGRSSVVPQRYRTTVRRIRSTRPPSHHPSSAPAHAQLLQHALIPDSVPPDFPAPTPPLPICFSPSLSPLSRTIPAIPLALQSDPYIFSSNLYLATRIFPCHQYRNTSPRETVRQGAVCDLSPGCAPSGYELDDFFPAAAPVRHPRLRPLRSPTRPHLRERELECRL